MSHLADGTLHYRMDTVPGYTAMGEAAITAEQWAQIERIIKQPTNVKQVEFTTSRIVPVENVLQGAMAAQLSEVLIVGRTQDGDKLYFAMSESDGPKILWSLELARQKLLTAFADEE